MKIKQYSELEVKINAVQADFESYLETKDSDRIIFSAPFGSGKTYFLNKFFLNNEKYNVVFLKPVNYSVANNVDIFELIKHDILFELLKKPDINYDKFDLDWLTSAKLYFDTNPIEFLKPFLFSIPNIGKKIEEVVAPFKKLYQKVKNHKAELTVDTKKEIIEFLKGISNERGNIYENDFISETVIQLLTQLKSDAKKTVLIVDDLDRIDPSHLFRILNVFAAHFDEDSNSNKFNFDYLIFVCDINNIKKIYESFYGKGVDFAGYMNKFHTKEIYEFDNVKSIILSVDEWLEKISFANQMAMSSDIFKDRNIYWRRWLIFLLVRMIHSKKLSLRAVKNQILRPYRYQTSLNALLITGRKYTGSQLSLFILFDILKSFFDNDIEAFSSSVQESDFGNPVTGDFYGLPIDELSRFTGDILIATELQNLPRAGGKMTINVNGINLVNQVSPVSDYIQGYVENHTEISSIDFDNLIKKGFDKYYNFVKTKISVR